MPAHEQQGRGNALRREQFLWRNFTNVTNHTKIFYFIALLVFCKFSYWNYRNGLNQVPQSWGPLSSQKNWAVLLLYLLLEIRILVCAQGALRQKFVCVSEIAGHHFPGWVENPKLRTHVHKQPFSSACEKYILQKTKIDVKQLKLYKFIFDVKHLKMNRFIKSISDLIISTWNATFEAPLLLPCY